MGGPRRTGTAPGESPGRRAVAAVLAAVTVTVLVVATGAVVAADATGDRDAATQATPGDAVLEDGGTYFVGQVLFTRAFDAGDRVELRRGNGRFVSDILLEDNGTVLLDSGRFGPGEYRLVNQDGTAIEFTLERHNYSVNVTESSVLNGGDDTVLRLFVDSNRGDYTHVVSSPNLSAGQLRSVFGTGTVEDRDDDGTPELAIESAEPVETLRADFDGVAPGRYTLRFAVRDTGVSETVTVRVQLFPAGTARLTAEGADPIRIQQAAGRQLAGTSTLPDDTPLRITVENASGNGFRLSEQVTVEDGRFVATFDFSGLPVGQRFTVTVRQGPVVRDRREGVVVRRAAVGEGASATADAVTLDSVSLPDGGYVVVSRVGGGGVVGVSDLLPPGERSDVRVDLSESLPPGEVELVVGLRRDDGDGTFDDDDPQYRLQGVDVTRVVRVTVPDTTTPTETVTATATATETATSTATATATATATSTATDTDTDGAGAAGLGIGAAAIGIGVIVLVLLLLLGSRRQDGGGEDGG